MKLVTYDWGLIESLVAGELLTNRLVESSLLQQHGNHHHPGQLCEWRPSGESHWAHLMYVHHQEGLGRGPSLPDIPCLKYIVDVYIIWLSVSGPEHQDWKCEKRWRKQDLSHSRPRGWAHQVAGRVACSCHTHAENEVYHLLLFQNCFVSCLPGTCFWSQPASLHATMVRSKHIALQGGGWKVEI